MIKLRKYITSFLLFSIVFNLASKDVVLPQIYPLVVEKLIFFKDKNIKVFWGGPVDRRDKGVKWIMPVSVEDEHRKTRAVYEIAFVNCSVDDARDAEVLFVDIADINIKLHNALSQDSAIFNMLMKGDYKRDKYIVVRSADVAMVYYPDIYVASLYGEQKPSDKENIINFLHKQFHTKSAYIDYYNGGIVDEIYSESDSLIVYKSMPVEMVYEENRYQLYVQKRIKKDDVWKVYYIISKIDVGCIRKNGSDFITVRFDSGCVSGQIYGDESCDCLEQLCDCLVQVAKAESVQGIVIHIPSHDGRGFGTAPKAETEIYKRGGQGKIHYTDALNTVEAARLLYGVDAYDIRSFEGAAEILKSMGIQKVILVTDNVEKVAVLQNAGIEVVRQKTNTNKVACIHHIEAKKQSNYYFSE